MSEQLLANIRFYSNNDTSMRLILSICLLSLALSACGIKGALYLPAPDHNKPTGEPSAAKVAP
ncbi:LPS translocon maturation chaperone LptM [Uliginosibacterium sediminicola]|uniref:Lipoprotein n=1 Tax=Uliginosibacterium sediminicola TaxID=2024550 RepID=A0ABU9YTR2_9RHOO